MATTASHRPPPYPLDLDITVVSAKHLKNVNWRNGDLSPYAIFWLHPDRRQPTKSDESNSTKPVWNERFLLPLPSTPATALLTLEIFHSNPSDTPKPLVGTLRLPLADLPDPEDSTRIRTFELRRPSGRPDGKIRLKLAIRQRPLPDYQTTPTPPYYYTPAPPPSYGRYSSTPYPYSPSLPAVAPPAAAAPPSPLHPPPPPSYQYGSYSDIQSSNYPGYYSQPPPPPSPRQFIDRQSSYGGGGPSAPVDYAQKPITGEMESGAALGGLAIDERLRKHEKEKIGEKAEGDFAAKEVDDYSGYGRRDY